MISNNKGHPNLTPLCLAEHPLVSDTANIAKCGSDTKQNHLFKVTYCDLEDVND
jgi:hypothetical protein